MAPTVPTCDHRQNVYPVPHRAAQLTTKWLWCGSPRHRYFRTTGEALAGVSRMTICLAKRLLFMRGTNWQDSFLIG